MSNKHYRRSRSRDRGRKELKRVYETNISENALQEEGNKSRSRSRSYTSDKRNHIKINKQYSRNHDYNNKANYQKNRHEGNKVYTASETQSEKPEWNLDHKIDTEENGYPKDYAIDSLFVGMGIIERQYPGYFKGMKNNCNYTKVYDYFYSEPPELIKKLSKIFSFDLVKLECINKYSIREKIPLKKILTEITLQTMGLVMDPKDYYCGCIFAGVRESKYKVAAYGCCYGAFAKGSGNYHYILCALVYFTLYLLAKEKNSAKYLKHSLFWYQFGSVANKLLHATLVHRILRSKISKETIFFKANFDDWGAYYVIMLTYMMFTSNILRSKDKTLAESIFQSKLGQEFFDVRRYKDIFKPNTFKNNPWLTLFVYQQIKPCDFAIQQISSQAYQEYKEKNYKIYKAGQVLVNKIVDVHDIRQLAIDEEGNVTPNQIKNELKKEIKKSILICQEEIAKETKTKPQYIFTKLNNNSYAFKYDLFALMQDIYQEKVPKMVQYGESIKVGAITNQINSLNIKLDCGLVFGTKQSSFLLLAAYTSKNDENIFREYSFQATKLINETLIQLIRKAFDGKETKLYKRWNALYITFTDPFAFNIEENGIIAIDLKHQIFKQYNNREYTIFKCERNVPYILIKEITNNPYHKLIFLLAKTLHRLNIQNKNDNDIDMDMNNNDNNNNNNNFAEYQYNEANDNTESMVEDKIYQGEIKFPYPADYYMKKKENDRYEGRHVLQKKYYHHKHNGFKLEPQLKLEAKAGDTLQCAYCIPLLHTSKLDKKSNSHLFLCDTCDQYFCQKHVSNIYYECNVCAFDVAREVKLDDSKIYDIEVVDWWYSKNTLLFHYKEIQNSEQIEIFKLTNPKNHYVNKFSENKKKGVYILGHNVKELAKHEYNKVFIQDYRPQALLTAIQQEYQNKYDSAMESEEFFNTTIYIDKEYNELEQYIVKSSGNKVTKHYAKVLLRPGVLNHLKWGMHLVYGSISTKFQRRCLEIYEYCKGVTKTCAKPLYSSKDYKVSDSTPIWRFNQATLFNHELSYLNVWRYFINKDKMNISLYGYKDHYGNAIKNKYFEKIMLDMYYHLEDTNSNGIRTNIGIKNCIETSKMPSLKKWAKYIKLTTEQIWHITGTNVDTSWFNCIEFNKISPQACKGAIYAQLPHYEQPCLYANGQKCGVCIIQLQSSVAIVTNTDEFKNFTWNKLKKNKGRREDFANKLFNYGFIISERCAYVLECDTPATILRHGILTPHVLALIKSEWNELISLQGKKCSYLALTQTEESLITKDSIMVTCRNIATTN